MRTPKLALFSSLVLIFAAGCGSNGSSARVDSKTATKAPAQKGSERSGKTNAEAPEETTDQAPTEGEDLADQEGQEQKTERDNAPKQEAVPRIKGGAPDPRVAIYKPKSWPEASLGRDGVAFLTLTAPGWIRDFYQVDPRRGQATLGFKSTLGKRNDGVAGAEAAVFITIRVHPNVRDARNSLLRTLLTVTSVLKREETLGDVAFTSRRGNSLVYAAAVRGNVTFIARSAETGIDASILANAADTFIKKSPAVNKEGVISKPAITGLGAELAKTGQANPLSMDSDPQSPKPTYIAFECSPRTSTSIVKNGEGYELYAGQPGSVSVKAFVCSDRLQISVFETEIEVVKGD